MCNIKLKLDAKPCFTKARPVTFALQGRVEEELTHLENEGVIERFDKSIWATPIVSVVKPDESILICADYLGQ